MIDEAEKQRKKNRAIRKARLARLLKEIEEGKFNNIQESKESVYPDVEKPREEYISPRDRDSYNYGYTTIPEMDGLHSPNVWE